MERRLILHVPRRKKPLAWRPGYVVASCFESTQAAFERIQSMLGTDTLATWPNKGTGTKLG